MRTRAERRFNDRNKALRKRRIARAVYSDSNEVFDYYRDLHTSLIITETYILTQKIKFIALAPFVEIKRMVEKCIIQILVLL